MPVIAVVNRKGGSGKSTIATHLAAYCAHQGIGVMLGDVDRQQSTRSWLRLREQRHPQAAPIMGWAVTQSTALRAPIGVSHVVLDTPGGLHGLDLARVVMFADAIVVPLCNSVFDRDSAAQCYEELKILPRISSGRCKLAVIGMRVDTRTLDSAALTTWAAERGLPYLGSLRDAPSYVQCIEQGVTIFDLPKETVSQDLAQWAPILQWMQPVIQSSISPAQPQERASSARVGSLQPVQQSLIHGERLMPRNSNQGKEANASSIATRGASSNTTNSSRGGLLEALVPSFLRRR